MSSQPFAVVNLKNVINNAKILKKACAPAKFCAVVKADGYGHGCAEIASAIDGVADFFAVGCVDEGVKLRFAGVTAPVLCLIPVSEREYDRARRYNVQVTLSSIAGIEKFCEYAKSRTAPAFQLAINSGMNRLGIDEEQFNRAATTLYSAGINGDGLFKGVFSHFYNASNYRSCEEQYLKFLRATDFFADFGVNFAHIASSGALYNYGNLFKMSAVRAGLALYGYLPDGLCGYGQNNASEAALHGLKPAMDVYASVFNHRFLTAGEHLLYGGDEISCSACADIAGYGYFYGLKRGAGIKPACMNMCAVEHNAKNVLSCEDLLNFSGEYGESLSDCVCIFNNAEEAAERAGVSVYEVLTSARNIRKYYLK